ncbi:MAG: vWA domain-containing protein [Gammaproteobacteria bacterium]
MNKKLSRIALALMCTVPFSQAAFSAAADIVFVVDESSSMGGEHSWISNMVTSLENALIAAGVGNGMDQNRYALVGFGDASIIGGHSYNVGSGTWGTAADLSAATASLLTDGGTEDGWDGINTGLGLTFRPGVAKNMILITDEDRDQFNGGLTFGGVLAGLMGQNFLLNAVVNYGYQDGASNTAFGIDSAGNAYLEDGFGSYNTSTGGVPVSGFGTTQADYINLALGTGGASWDLNVLRLGGLSAQAFTEAFVDIKVNEITEQVPLPAVPALMMFGLLGWWQLRRKRV